MNEKTVINTAAFAAPAKPAWRTWSKITSLAFGLLCVVKLYSIISTPTRSYPGESVQWEACGNINDHEIECSNITVPIDQFDLERASDKTFEIPLIRLRGKNATQNLVVNPGGPGGSGGSFIWRKGAQLNRIVGESFHILSFDPRGINQSRPLASCYPDTTTRKEHTSSQDTDSVADSIKRFAWTQNYVRACEENMGEHGKYINTPQTAADMNSILDAVGQEDMFYWGFSYGTLLGQTYASLFPDRSHRVIIDGVVDQVEWYEEKLLMGDFVDTENVVDGFFDECFKSGDKCPLHQLGRSKDEIQLKVVSFLKELELEPLSVFVNTTLYGTLDYTDLWGAIFGHMYKPATWLDLATRLDELLRGNATSAFLEYGTDNVATDDAVDVVYLNDAASGPSHWPKTREELVDILEPFYNSSSFAISEAQTIYAKQQWRIPKTHTFKPPRKAATAHPLLILSTTYDPICPLHSAKGAEATFVDSRLVEVKGYGHCSLAVPSACIARHVRGFLLDGKMPEKGAKCEVDEPYFQEPKPEKTDEEQIYAAQALMAMQRPW
ncbi:Alpha/Beta hydrolase protein [Dactylonectria macrodidyma]|uniref:Alpha/Beta hydrolase protein n=1 Tax=Dactylonectria macrodidyma TaxID=307937 RepID=A0A9P9IU91_9HYPO|nr:Alpha/Beta hydrolase protein [Dactylonectria macrodidyma]